MKTTKRVTFSLLALSIAAGAQQSPAPSVLPEPETLNVFYRLQNGTLVPLEQQITPVVQLQHGFMSAKVAVISVIPGGKSPVRFQMGPLEFAVAMGGDPAVWSLWKLEIKEDKKKGDRRELLIATAQGAVFRASKVKANTAERLDLSRYGTSSYRAVPKQPLGPGEYAFWRADSQTVFCFGVD